MGFRIYLYLPLPVGMPFALTLLNGHETIMVIVHMKDLVTKYAQDVRGVNGVVNPMTIEATPSKTNEAGSHCSAQVRD
jgi:hypothetical protein